MKLESALEYLYSSHIDKRELTDSFILYSQLSDLCSDNYDSVRTYWKIIQKINLFESLIDKGFNKGITYLREKCSEYSGHFLLEEFELMLNYTLKAMNYFNGKSTKNKINTSEDFGFKIKNNILYKYSGRKSVVVIPETVKVIKANAIDGLKSIKKIIIPDTVEKIESFAINNLENLEEIEIGNVKRIDELAFFNCKGEKKTNEFRKENGYNG